MAREVEIKIKVDDHDPIRVRLAELGADRLGRVLETNRLFDDAQRSLKATDRGLRIRTCRRLQGDREAGPIVATRITFKGPREPSEAKQREEIETGLDDGQAGQAILEALGYFQVVGFEKRRESWRLGACQVELDELPELGLFVEIEGPDLYAIRSVRDQLGLASSEEVKKTYIGLLVGQRRGDEPREQVFRFSP